MLFNSYIFIFVFLPVTLFFYSFSRKFIGRESSFLILTLASLIYYAYWKVSYLPILLTSIIFNYLLGLFLSRHTVQKTKKKVLISGIITNLLILGYYKYADFFLDNLSFLTNESYSTLQIMLPLAISFFTFQQIAYLIDAYRGETKEYSFTHYCLFISFFPQLIAGPIVHHKDMLPQFMDKTRKIFDVEMFWQGLLQFCLGLFKKVIIADTIALFSTPIFFAADHGGDITMIEAWVAILAYTFQLYFDFSAYSDMAIGIGKMFGINLPINFNSPYKAKSISDFWCRWHMTLSRFLRDYVYISLGGNRKGEPRRYINLMLTMLIGGLWHGASWNFVVWGGLHGIYLVINHAWVKLMEYFKLSTQNTGYQLAAQFLTFFVVIEAWVLFRAETFSGATKIYLASIQFQQFSFSTLLNGELQYLSEPAKALSMLTICTIITFFMPNSQEFINGVYQGKYFKQSIILRKKLPAFLAVTVSGLLVFSIASMNKVSEFLYFQF